MRAPVRACETFVIALKVADFFSLFLFQSLCVCMCVSKSAKSSGRPPLPSSWEWLVYYITHTHTRTHTFQQHRERMMRYIPWTLVQHLTWTHEHSLSLLQPVYAALCVDRRHTPGQTHTLGCIYHHDNVCKHWTILSSSHLSPLPLCSHPLSYQDFFCNCRITEWQWLSATQAHCLCSLFVPSQMLSKLGCHLTLLRSANGDCG